MLLLDAFAHLTFHAPFYLMSMFADVTSLRAMRADDATAIFFCHFLRKRYRDDFFFFLICFFVMPCYADFSPMPMTRFDYHRDAAFTIFAFA